MKRTLLLSIVTLALVAVSPAMAQKGGKATDPADKSTATEASASSATTTPSPDIIILVHKPLYPFTVDVSNGKPLPEKPIEYVKGGKLFRLESEGSKAAVDTHFDAYAKQIDDAVKGQQKPTYPLKKSVVSDKDIDETKAVDKVWNNRLYRLADATEEKTFEDNKTAAKAKLDKAYIDMQLPTYPYKKDPVSKEDLAGKETYKHLYGNKLILFTSAANAATFDTKPEEYLKILETLK
jgi:YHS domain-containing protein